MTINELIRRLEAVRAIHTVVGHENAGDINVVLTDCDGGLIAITGVHDQLLADPNGDLFVSLDTDETII